MTTSLASLLLGMLCGVNLLFAVLLLPALFHLLLLSSARSYAVHLLSLYYLFCGALGGMALVLLFAAPCADSLLRSLVCLVCVSYWLVWQQARHRLILLDDRARLGQIQAGLQILNTAQWAVCAVAFIQLQAATCY